MHLVQGHDKAVCDWLASTFGVHVLHHPRVVYGVVDSDGVLRGAYILTLRNDTTAELHAYGVVSNDAAKQLFTLAYRACGLYRLELCVPRKSRAVRRGVLKMGFCFEGIAREYYGPGEDAFCYGMTAPQCRWIRGTNGQHVLVA